MAKLLQGGHGRTMLTELDHPTGNPANPQVHIGPDWQQEIEAMGEPYARISMSKSSAPASGQHQRVLDTGAAGTGTGSYVQIRREQQEVVTGEHGDPSSGIPPAVAMPHYIALGHELGHAWGHLKGEAHHIPTHNPAFSHLAMPARLAWTSAEEHRNINTNENPLRAEHGLPLRSFHRPPKTVRAPYMRDEYKRRYDELSEHLPDHRLDELNPINPQGMTFPNRPDLLEPSTYEEANRLPNTVYHRPRLQTRQEFRQTTTNWLGLCGSDPQLGRVDRLLDKHAALMRNAPTDRSVAHAHQGFSDQHLRNLHRIRRELEDWQRAKQHQPDNKYRQGVAALLEQVKGEQRRQTENATRKNLRIYAP